MKRPVMLTLFLVSFLFSGTVAISQNIGIGTSTPTEQLTITENFELPDASSPNEGVIVKSGYRYIHNYGNYNNFLGIQAGNFTMTGYSNIGIGDDVMRSLTAGSSNTAIGDYAMVLNTTGDRNIAIGASALEQNVSGFRNIAIGVSAMNYNTVCSENIAIGDGALQASAISPVDVGTKNMAIGYQALYNTSPNSETNGRDNIGIGYNVMRENITGANNTAVGNYACWTTNGLNNTAFGMRALVTNQTGSSNVAIGYQTLQYNIYGSENIAIGNNCGVSAATSNLSNTIVIGNNVQANLNNMVILGNASNNAFRCYAVYNATTPGVYDVDVDDNGQLMRVSSSKRYKTDITDLEINTEGIYQLRPVSFTGINDNQRHFGLIAEEVAQVIPELAIFERESSVIPGSQSDRLIPESVRYPLLSVLLLKEVQKHEDRIKILEKELAEKDSEIQSIRNEINDLRSQLQISAAK